VTNGGQRRRRQAGGAYVDLPSFMGDTTGGNPSMDPYNVAAGGYGDPTSAGAIADSRLGESLDWKW